ncbi:MAG: hypothetical protein QOF03_1262 [Alphaproteobacteria bacterium]|jgi:hypothetical protein|nr:hypothetical protein [Alphaproteobacteria bacterium]
MAEVHFEVFRKMRRGGEWSLVEVITQRDDAVKYAKVLVEEGATAVRVMKETHEPETGDYMSLSIFEHGATESKKKNTKLDDGANSTPCFKPDDLYSYHARATMGRVMAEWLGRHKLTPTEFIHTAAALEKFEATGTVFQHAIQKVAVSQAAEAESSVAQIVKSLNELCTIAMNRVFKDERRGSFPTLEAGQFGPLAENLAANPEGRYVLNGALAKYLATAASWDAKLRNILILMAELPSTGPGRVLLLSAIDVLVSEILTGAAALADLLGQNPDLGHALMNLVELFLGDEVHVGEGGGQGINELARFFARDELPYARQSIASRIITELKGMKRLCPGSIDEEFKMLRRLGNKLVRGQGKYLSHEDLMTAFQERSKRLVSHEPLLQFMQNAKTPDEKLERLLTVEENIVGAENKRMLSTFVIPIISSNSFEAELYTGSPTRLRLRRVAELQERVLRSGFQEVQKNQIASALDKVAQRIDERSRFLASIETRVANPNERMDMIFKLCTAGVFTQGALMTKARQLLIACLAKPGFLVSYTAQLEQIGRGGITQDEALTELASQLEKIGIAQADAMRALAA